MLATADRGGGVLKNFQQSDFMGTKNEDREDNLSIINLKNW